MSENERDNINGRTKEMNEEIVEKLKSLLEKASLISAGPRRQKNYFEVAGFPNYENVASSILAFFFDTNEEHGLRDLWLRSLMECYQLKSNDDPQRDIYGVSRYETVPSGVVREDVASDNSRLDIVIPTTNDFVVAIENKLFAKVNNPLDSYHEWINTAYKYEINIEVLLSLKPVGDETILIGKDSHGSTYRFVNITYKDLFSAVKTKAGPYLSGANEKWLIYMNEFVKNIESLQEGNMSINKEWQLFLEENNDLIGDYNRKIQYDHKAKVELVKHFARNLQERFDSEATCIPTGVRTYVSQNSDSHISLVIEPKENKQTIVFESCFLEPGSKKQDHQRLGVFYVSFWIRQRDCREEGIAWLKEALTKSNTAYVERQFPDWGITLEIEKYDYAKEVNDQEVEDCIFDVWTKIAKEIRSESKRIE